MSARVPLVGYLVLDEGEPHLVATKCEHCGAPHALPAADGTEIFESIASDAVLTER